MPVAHAVQVTKRLRRAGLWTQVRYKLVRNGQEFETPLVTAPAEKPASIENYVRVVGLLYLFIGLFIFARRWNAPRAVHFYVFCLVSFVLYSFHYSGKLDAFDQEVYWAKICCAAAGAGAAAAFRAGVSGARRDDVPLLFEVAAGVWAAAGVAAVAREHRAAMRWDSCRGSVRAFCSTRSS